jgi:tetratricopeptide (TPR) repeat protein
MNCPKCNAPIKEGHEFCGQCGHKIETAPAVAPDTGIAEEPLSEADEKAIELLIQGVELHFEGKLKQALKLFLQAEKIAPHRQDVYENLGNIYRDMPDFNKAIEYYNRSIELDPDYAPAYANRGVAYQMNGHTGNALKDFSRALELEPTHPEALFSRASMFIDGGHLDAALVDLNQLILVEPNFGQAYLSRGFIFQQEGDFPKAEADYRRAIELMDDTEALKDAHALLKQVIS